MASDSPDCQPADPPGGVHKILFVTGMLGAGKTTVLRELEDLGWEVIDNFPIRLLGRLIGAEPVQNHADPLAVGFDCRTRGFDPAKIVAQVRSLAERDYLAATTLFLDCAGHELERRFNETRRRHYLAHDLPVTSGIAAERELLAPLRGWADMLIDTTHFSGNELKQTVRDRFASEAPRAMTVTVSSFGFARGMPPAADLVFDMRYLDNPHWDPDLRALTGRDEPVGAHVERDPAFASSYARIRDLPARTAPRATARRARAMSTSPSVAPAGGIARCSSPSGSRRTCAPRAFRPRCCTATWQRALPERSRFRRAADDAAKSAHQPGDVLSA